MDAAKLFLFGPIPAKAKNLGLLSIYKFSLGGGVPIPTRGHTLWCSIYISTLCPRILQNLRDVVFQIVELPLYILKKYLFIPLLVLCSNVKPTFFQDRKLSFCCFCSKKDRIYSFLKQNSGSKQKVFIKY